MKKVLLSLLMLIAFSSYMQAATRANVYVTAQLAAMSMSLTATDIQMTGRIGGTLRNNTVEFGSITSLTNGQLATAPETLKVDFEPGNNIFSIQISLSNGGEGYDYTKFKGSKEAAYWNLGSEANGLIGTNIHDYVAAMLWTCLDDNTATYCSTNNIKAANWTFIKDEYTHVGENASGLLLATNAFGAGVLEGKTNGSLVVSAGHRPMETWDWTWQQDFSKAVTDPLHWVKGVTASGYRNVVFGTGGQYYVITTPNVSETTPTTDKTVYLSLAANFQAKPAQYYRTRKLFLDILAN